MITDISELLLWFAVAWPLLLAIPALHARLPWPRHLAIVPAAALAVLPNEASLELPWLFFGTGFAIEGETRWILLMSLVVWLTAAAISKPFVKPSVKPSGNDFADQRSTTFFLLTLAGNLGVVLTTDLVGFFSFATLMGYGLYGLLIQDGDAAARRASRLYLIFLIVADVMLFEALLLAAFNTENLRFELVREAMAQASSSQFYLWMVFIGFALKAGAWPFHLWLSAAFTSAPRSTTLLLSGVPVAMGLLGAVRWLPLGEYALGNFATSIQILGAATVIYAALRFFTQTSVKIVWATIAATGLFITALGAGLAYPEIGRQYEVLAYPFIAALAILLAIPIFIADRMRDSRQSPALASQRVETVSRWMTGRASVLRQWSNNKLSAFQRLWRVSRLTVVDHYQRIIDGQKPKGLVDEWSVRIILFVLLGVVLAWLSG